jgi:2,4-dienoyl-CoA reductase-like NADH-dependent reductase (Old Yellow Enzyme family)
VSPLFSPYRLGPVSLRNRIAVAPMCQYSADDGRANEWHLIHLGHLALSGAGLMFTEATAVEPVGRISAQDLGLWSDETEAALKPVVDAVRRHSSIRLGMQVSHAGRKASTALPWRGGRQVPPAHGGWQTVAPSALPHDERDIAPLALDDAGLARIKAAFVDTSLRAQRLGFELIELHAAHGYLLHQFLSPLANQRRDRYGGALENRMRYPLEVFDAVRAALPGSIPVGVRLSATDWVDGGWDLAQSVAFAQALKPRGAAFIDVSSGGVSPRQQIALGPGYQVPFAERIRAESGLPVIAVGLITTPAQAEAIVAGGQADVVALARAMLYDARWPWHAAAALGAQVEAPPQYLRSQPREFKDLFVPGPAAAR